MFLEAANLAFFSMISMILKIKVLKIVPYFMLSVPKDIVFILGQKKLINKGDLTGICVTRLSNLECFV